MIKEKKCPHCGRILPVEQFGFKDKAHTKLNSWCSECTKQKSKEIRAANIEKYRELDKAKKAKTYAMKREIVDSFKSKGCIICGEKETACLDFHHLNPSEKDFQVSALNNKGLKTILAEIEKCVILCANCHRKLHANLIELPNDTNLQEEKLDIKSE